MRQLDALASVDAQTIAAPDTDSVLLDVRDDHEWIVGHAPQAVHIPMSEFPGRVGELDRTRRIVCICRSGNRSSRVTAWLLDQGFDAVNLAGGMQAWARLGLPILNHHGQPGAVI